MATLLNVVEVLKGMNFIMDSINKELSGPSLSLEEIKILIERLVVFEPILWQLRGLFGEKFEYEEVGKPLSPFATNGDFVPYLVYLKAGYKVELGLNFRLWELDNITFSVVRVKDNTILFNHSILRDKLKTMAYSDLLSLINDFRLNKDNKELARKMFELKVYTLLSMAFVDSFLDFPTYGCKVIVDGYALKNTVEAIYRIKDFLNKIGNSTFKVLSNAWTLGVLL
jgi:hypothetical protein